MATLETPGFAERFWARVQKSDECWVWLGERNRRGYGRLSLNNKREVAHHVAWMLAFGSIPEGMWLLHACDNRPCCRPEHLWLGTHRDNMADMVAKGRSASGDRNGMRLDLERARALLAEVRKTHTSRQLPWVKLSQSSADEIRRRSAAESHSALARAFGVSRKTIWEIVNNKIWIRQDDER